MVVEEGGGGWSCRPVVGEGLAAGAVDDGVGRVGGGGALAVGRGAAGELIVRRVEEFLVEGAARTRWFELDGLVYEPTTRRLSIGSDGRSQFALTVEGLDVILRIRPQTRPHP